MCGKQNSNEEICNFNKIHNIAHGNAHLYLNSIFLNNNIQKRSERKINSPKNTIISLIVVFIYNDAHTILHFYGIEENISDAK